MKSLRLIRVINNNALIASEDTFECVLLGKGIGFAAQRDGEINRDLVFKKYELKNQQEALQYASLIDTIPSELFQLSEKHVNLAKKRLNKPLRPALVLTLADHLSSMVQRAKTATYLQNGMLWDIKRLYKDEYELGMALVNEFNQIYATVYDEHEATNLAMHFMNASLDEWGDVEKINRIINDVLSIVGNYFSIEFDESTYTYYRFVVHLRFFAQRMLHGQMLDTIQENEVADYISAKFQVFYECAVQIREYAINTHGYDLNAEECLYLTMHITRVVEESRKSKGENA